MKRHFKRDIDWRRLFAWLLWLYVIVSAAVILKHIFGE